MHHLLVKNTTVEPLLEYCCPKSNPADNNANDMPVSAIKRKVVLSAIQSMVCNSTLGFDKMAI